MTSPGLNFDAALLGEFIDESLDNLNQVDPLFVELEQRPQDLEIIQSIFRPVHSIKGNAAFFGFLKTKKLAHELETLLDQMRHGARLPSRDLISGLLEGIDELRSILDDGRDGNETIRDQQVYDHLLERVQALQQSDGADWASIFACVDRLQGALGEEAEQATVVLQELVTALRAMGGDEKDAGDAVPDDLPLPKQLTTLRGMLDEPIDEQATDELSHAVLENLQALEELAPDDATADLVAEALDAYHTFIDTVGFDELLAEMLREKTDDLMVRWAQFITAGATESSDDASTPQADTAASAVPERAVSAASRTMRIAEGHVDEFLEYVGELLVVGDMFEHLRKRMESGDGHDQLLPAFRRANGTFGSLANALQESIMSIRMVSMKSLLQKTPRLVRDIAAASGKQINVDLSGQDHEVDKSLIDLLDAPLTHLVRNAADHGIEPPEDRKAAGKPETGHITVSAELTSTELVLTVKDDGKGIDRERLRGKAEELGLIRANEALDEQAIVQLLFRSGLSTAAEVTDVSGRGVGMDVVKQMVDQAGGRITVETEPGVGSTFRVHLPKTVVTQIMSGYMVAAGGVRYVLPLNRVREAAAVDAEQIGTVHGRGRGITRHNRFTPVVSLTEVLGEVGRAGNSDADFSQRVLVSIDQGAQSYLLAVDEVLGVQQVVLRSIEGLPFDQQLLRGGALMGDGSVALVLDPDAVTTAAFGGIRGS